MGICMSFKSTNDLDKTNDVNNIKNDDNIKNYNISDVKKNYICDNDEKYSEKCDNDSYDEYIDIDIESDLEENIKNVTKIINKFENTINNNSYNSKNKQYIADNDKIEIKKLIDKFENK